MSTKISREQAQNLNPLIGINAKDTYSQVAAAMRALSECDGIHEAIVSYIASLGAAALEYEEAQG